MELEELINDDGYKKSFSEFISISSKEWFDKQFVIDEVNRKRYSRFTKYVKTIDFDKLLYRLISEHNDDYIDKCHNNGFESFPNNKLQFLLNYISGKYNPVKVNAIDCDYSNQIWHYKGYYFQIVYGQGSFLRIYNKKDLRLLLQV